MTKDKLTEEEIPRPEQIIRDGQRGNVSIEIAKEYAESYARQKLEDSLPNQNDIIKKFPIEQDVKKNTDRRAAVRWAIQHIKEKFK